MADAKPGFRDITMYLNDRLTHFSALDAMKNMDFSAGHEDEDRFDSNMILKKKYSPRKVEINTFFIHLFSAPHKKMIIPPVGFQILNEEDMRDYFEFQEEYGVVFVGGGRRELAQFAFSPEGLIKEVDLNEFHKKSKYRGEFSVDYAAYRQAMSELKEGDDVRKAFDLTLKLYTGRELKSD